MPPIISQGTTLRAAYHLMRYRENRARLPWGQFKALERRLESLFVHGREVHGRDTDDK